MALSEQRKLAQRNRKRMWRMSGRCYECGHAVTRGFKSCESCRLQRRLYANRQVVTMSRYAREWQRRNKQRYRANVNRWRKVARRENPAYAVIELCRKRLGRALKAQRVDRIRHTKELIGCMPSELIVHLENQFTMGMSWQNRDLWHIDHIRPVASFDLSDPEQQKQCFHYTNLQPLWSADNHHKGKRYAKAAA